MDIFRFKEYRKFLNEWLLTEKKHHRLNASQLAEKIRVHPTFISQVLKGNKDLSSEQWISICDLMNLTEIEKDFLHFLLLHNRSGTQEARAFYQKKIDEILKKRLQLKERMKEHTQLSDREKAIFYSSWLYSAIRLFSACESGQTIEQISHKFQISRSKTESIVSFLCSTGLCTLDNGKVLLGNQHIHVPANSTFAIRHHINWRLRSINSLEHVTDEELNFTAPMSISKKDFSQIREKIIKLIQDTVEIAKASDAEDLATLTIDFFWPIK